MAQKVHRVQTKGRSLRERARDMWMSYLRSSDSDEVPDWFVYFVVMMGLMMIFVYLIRWADGYPIF